MTPFHLRPLERRDSVRMLEWMRDPDITRYLQIGGPDTSEETVLRFIDSARDESENLHRAIVNEEDEYLGTITLKHIDRKKGEAECAISMHRSALGTGASAAGTSLIAQLAFEELGLARIYLNVLEENRRAVRFYEKVGFQYTHTGTLERAGELKPLLWFEMKADT